MQQFLFDVVYPRLLTFSYVHRIQFLFPLLALAVSVNGQTAGDHDDNDDGV